MAQPVWITPAGSLGTIPEGIFFQLVLSASVPTLTTRTCTATSSGSNRVTCNSTADLYAGLEVYFSGAVFGGLSSTTRYFVQTVVNNTQFTLSTFEDGTGNVTLTTAAGSMTASFNQHPRYVVQAGALPAGIQCSDNGLLEGIPRAVASLQGIPFEVAEDVTSKFTVRAYTKTQAGVIDRISERTFTLTVTGQDAPEFTTPAGQIAQYYDGSLVDDLQIGYTDTDPDDVVVVRLIAGKLPTGLTISPKGLISGFIQPLPVINQEAGYSRDGQGYDQFPYDFSTQSQNANYEFVLEVSDGKSNNLRTFSIFVYSKNSMTADAETITPNTPPTPNFNGPMSADNTFITADVSPVRVPILLNPQGSIGTVRNDNFFAYKFNGLDLDGDQFEYALGFDPGDSTILPGLTLDPNTGWLYGYIPNLGLTELVYNFYVRVYKKDNPDVISNPYDYSLSIVGPVDTDVTWLTPSNLGVIVNGSTSTLYVEAVNTAGIPLQYQLESGSDSSLPQGLELLPSGEIAGRVSFDTFALDLGTTTFDVTLNDLGVTGEDTETTFDMTYTFTVNAYSVNGLVSVFKDFTITLDRVYNEPYENLYVQCMPPQNDRDLINDLLQNADIFQNELLYRPADPNFGRATQVIYDHAFGLRASTVEEYYSSLYENHYWKTLTLGAVSVAQATNSAGEVIYEVVYSRIIDNLLNNQGQSVSKQVTLPYPINEGDLTEINTVYPNSLINMRDQVIDTVGQVGTILPPWMTSKQKNGRVLGFVPAWVIAYAKPGKGNQLAYYINQQFGQRLNLIDFEVDRYELDRLLTKNWDPIADSTGGAWEPTPAETTFDLDNHYQLPSNIVYDGGTGYAIGDRILILGSQVGGVNGTNNITITVEQVNEFGTIEQARASGVAPLFSTGDTYTNIAGTNISGSGAVFTVLKNAQIYTVIVTNRGTDYAVGSQLTVLGSSLGGSNITNNATITVTAVDSSGGITAAIIDGTATSGTVSYTSITGTVTTGSGATWDIEVVGADATIFDGSSLRFIAPVDMYSNTQEYDKYLVFPYKNIVNPEELSGPVSWTNDSGARVTWDNNSDNPVTWINSII